MREKKTEAHPARTYNDYDSDIVLWHNRLAHGNIHDVARAAGLPAPKKPLFCNGCVEGKSKKHPLRRQPTPVYDAPRPAYCFAIDAAGPFRTTTLTGEKYLFLLVCIYSSRLFPMMSRNRSDFLALFKQFVTYIKAEFGKERVIAQIIVDGAKELAESTAVEHYCASKGIYRVVTPPYTPNLNPAESAISVILPRARAMMIHAGAPPSTCGYALIYAAHVINRVPRNYNGGEYATRIEKWTGRPQPHAHQALRVWGSAVWKTHVDGGLSKFESRAELHVFLGIDPRTKAYILGTLPHMKLERTPHCTFNESRFPWKETTAGRLTGPPTSTAEGDPLTSPTPADLAPQRPSRLWCPSARQLENIVNQADSHPASQQPSDVQASVSVFMEDVVAGAGSQRPAGAPLELTERLCKDLMALSGEQLRSAKSKPTSTRKRLDHQHALPPTASRSSYSPSSRPSETSARKQESW